MTKSIFHLNFRNCDMELAGSTHDLSLDRTRPIKVSANLSIRGLQAHGLEILPIPHGILLMRDVHLLDLAPSRRETSGVGRLIGSLCHGSRMIVGNRSGERFSTKASSEK